MTFRHPLPSGGTLGAICLNTSHRNAALKHLASNWEILPRDTFKAEGTQGETILLSITKQP